eukprot:4202694-Pleurochrysis_carterae.AAC.1
MSRSGPGHSRARAERVVLGFQGGKGGRRGRHRLEVLDAEALDGARAVVDHRRRLRAEGADKAPQSSIR